jgi:hypothetical protein
MSASLRNEDAPMCVESQSFRQNCAVFHCLWSIPDMADRFRVSSFATVMGQLRESATLVNLSGPNDSAAEDLIRAALRDAEAKFSELKLSQVLRAQWQRLLERAYGNAPLLELAILIREMHNNLLTELTAAYFLMIPADRRFIYEQPRPIFGEEAHRAFPDAQRDIAAAGRCYGLDEWTACIFHLMRALEHGLRWLGVMVTLDPVILKTENWKNIIDQIEKKIRELESLPKSADKTAKTQFLSEAASQFRWFKDAWRNDVSHANVFYDEREAVPIFLHVSDFFRHIASEAVKDSGGV